MSGLSDNHQQELKDRLRVVYEGFHYSNPPGEVTLDAMLELFIHEVLLWRERQELDRTDDDGPYYEADITRDQLMGLYSARVWFVEDGVRSFVGSPFGLFGSEETITEAATRMAKLHKCNGTVRLDV